jgi:hypothetical protein
LDSARQDGLFLLSFICSKKHGFAVSSGHVPQIRLTLKTLTHRHPRCSTFDWGIFNAERDVGWVDLYQSGTVFHELELRRADVIFRVEMIPLPVASTQPTLM